MSQMAGVYGNFALALMQILACVNFLFFGNYSSLTLNFGHPHYIKVVLFLTKGLKNCGM